MKYFILTLIALFAIVSLSPAQSESWKIDPTHSSITFAIDYMVLTEVTGSFKEFSGAMHAPADSLAKGAFTVAIKAGSINTDNEKRDGHLRSADFFDAEKFPEISFVSSSIRPTSGNSYSITGNLTMRGVTKPVVITAKQTGQMKDPWGNIRKGFKGTLTVNRSEFGVKYNSALETGGFVLGEDVDVTINAQFIKEQPAAAN